MTVDLFLSKAIDVFLIARKADGYSLSTVAQYKWGLDRFLLHCGDKKITDYKINDFRSYLTWLRTEYKPNRKSGNTDPLSSGSLFNAWKAIRSFYLWACQEYQFPRPDLDWKRPRFEYPEIIPFTKDEINAILNASEYTASAKTVNRKPFKMRRHTSKRDRAIILLLLDSGIRVSECARLKISDINLIVGEIHVQPFQSSRKSKPRTVPISPLTCKSISQYISLRDYSNQDLLFITRNKQPMNKDSIRLMLNEIGKRANVSDVNPHRFRHTFAIQYLRNGADIFTLKKILGHSTLKMVEAYLSIANIDVASAHRRASPVDNWKL